MFDIDIDFADRDKALQGLHHISATLAPKNGQINKHPSGVYFQNIPLNPISHASAFDFERAESLGYFKIDFLNQSVYQQIIDETHLDRLMNKEPMWDLLDEPSFCEKLIHIRNHFDIVQSVNPRSIGDLAIVLALIRPGKKHLIGRPRTEIDDQVWKLDQADGYVFRKAHAVSYAALIVVQMNLIVEQLMSEDDGISI